jgi:gamma-glutamyltranspeptidase/glutathione hydrolase
MNSPTFIYSQRGMVNSPHPLASQSGLSVLQNQGNALEAAIAVAANLAVVCPQLCDLGSDSVWLVSEPGQVPFVIDGSGLTASRLSAEFYPTQAIPQNGAASACTVAGTVAAWQTAFHYSRYHWQGKLSLTDLLNDAIYYAQHGYTQPPAAKCTVNTIQVLDKNCIDTQQVHDELPLLVSRPRLAATLKYLSAAGLWDFYRGDLAHSIASDLAKAGSPVNFEDLRAYQPQMMQPLAWRYGNYDIYSPGLPATSLISLLTLKLFAYWRPTLQNCHGAEYIHILLQASKQAQSLFLQYLDKKRKYDDIVPWQQILSKELLHDAAARIDPQHCSTIEKPLALCENRAWFAIIDQAGRCVSAQQSSGSEFGSGICLAGTGIGWHNRGACLSFDSQHPQAIAPRRQLYHVMQPLVVRGEQDEFFVFGHSGNLNTAFTLSNVLLRHFDYGEPFEHALSTDYWLEQDYSLRVNAHFDMAQIEKLQRMGYVVKMSDDEPHVDVGLLRRYSNKFICGAADFSQHYHVAGF